MCDDIYTCFYQLGVEELEIINIDNVNFTYPDGNKKALKNINLKVNEGEFILIVGPSGCGKSTLIRLLNRIIPDYYGGTLEGNVYINNKDIDDFKKDEIVTNVGMVYQHPEKQIVLQDVEREIAFGLENLNKDINFMKRNVSEVMSLLSLNGIKEKQTDEISGGQKQRVAIASVLAMNPDILLFDEPISQLDPINGEEVLNSIKRLNVDMGKTIILVEQRLDKCFHMADRIIFMENGEIIEEGTSTNIPKSINKKYHLPNIAYVFRQAQNSKLPITVKEGRDAIKDIEFKNIEKDEKNFSNKVLKVDKVNFEYERGSKTLKNINFDLGKGEIMAVMGENGAGKSTLFKIMAGIIEDYKGKIILDEKNLKKFNINERIKKIGYLSQNPNDYFGRETVFDEVSYTLKNINEYDEDKVINTLKDLDLVHLKDRNPRDLSGGEKQRTAIACTLIANPDILILDEPTRGMDSVAKENLGKIIKSLIRKGKSIIIVTHDADFVGDYADTVMLMFNGEIVAKGKATDILCDSLYYSPQISKVFKKKCRVIKSKDAIELLKVM